MLFDAHCHLQRLPSLAASADAVGRARGRGVGGAAVCGCGVEDWTEVEELYRPIVKRGLGLKCCSVKGF